jgi:hypothetical protein
MIHMVIRLRGGKPAIHLYPEEEMEVEVVPEFAVEEGYFYPEVGKGGGWKVRARPDGRLVDSGGVELNYLFWEGLICPEVDLSRGFVVSRARTESFLEESLEKLGLNAAESALFIQYWGRKLRKSAWNFITFVGMEGYARRYPLRIEPAPETTLRVFMAYKGVSEGECVGVREQELKGTERRGFTVVEWGGGKVKV